MTDQEFKEKLGQKVNRIRKEKDLTLYQLALKTQAHKSTIMRIEKADVSPSANLLRKISIALEVPLEELVKVE